MNDRKRVQELLSKYLTDNITTAESKELELLLDTPVGNEVVSEDLHKLFSLQLQDQYHLPDTDARIKRKVNDIIKNQPLLKRSTGSRMHFLKTAWVRYAAAIILVLGSAAYLIFKTQGRSQEEGVATKPILTERDVAPGHYGAVLTLADGRKVVLDSSVNGMIASQGHTQIMKTGDGQLKYTVVDEKPGEPLYNMVTTPRGGQYAVLLPDGSRVWLNAASSIQFPVSFSERERKVLLTGEGYFEVVKNSSAPFIVAANGAEVTVLGTHFNINGYADEPDTRVTLLEGSVKVSAKSAGGKRYTQLLKPGQQARFRQQGAIQLVTALNTEQVVAWKNGFFRFKNTNIQEIMRQVARWYNVDVRYVGDVSNKAFTGVVSRHQNLSALLNMLEMTQDIRFNIEEGNKVTVLP